MLPWRGIDNAYYIWLSEVILQQTRVEQGRAYYERFISLFPTVNDLAQASEREVLAAWQGLGYYSRARHLHQAAKQIAAMEAFPSDYATLRDLPGVGDYTASAVASLAYNLPYAVVDGNVYRVLSRFFGMDDPIDTTAGRSAFKRLATEVLDARHSATHNQALMDFGAMVCTPRAPRCADCPLHDACAMIVSQRHPEDFPVRHRRVGITVRHFAYVFVVTPHHMMLHRRTERDIWQGLYEPLLYEPAEALPVAQLAQQVAQTFQLPPTDIVLEPTVSQMRHQLTHQLLLCDAYLLRCEEPTDLQLPAHYEWISLNQLEDYPIPRLIERLWHKTLQAH